MANKLFSFFKQGSNTYEVKDAQARADIASLNASKIETTTKQITLTSSGNSSLSMLASDYIVLAVDIVSTHSTVVFSKIGVDTNNNYYANFTDPAGAAYGSTTPTVRIAYIKLTP